MAKKGEDHMFVTIRNWFRSFYRKIVHPEPIVAVSVAPQSNIVGQDTLDRYQELYAQFQSVVLRDIRDNPVSFERGSIGAFDRILEASNMFVKIGVGNKNELKLYYDYADKKGGVHTSVSGMNPVSGLRKAANDG